MWSNPRALFPRNRWLERWTWKTGAFGLEGFFRRRLLARLPPEDFELALVDGGELIGPRVVDALRSRCDLVVNYNSDDGFGHRDWYRFASTSNQCHATTCSWSFARST